MKVCLSHDRRIFPSHSTVLQTSQHGPFGDGKSTYSIQFLGEIRSSHLVFIHSAQRTNDSRSAKTGCLTVQVATYNLQSCTNGSCC